MRRSLLLLVIVTVRDSDHPAGLAIMLRPLDALGHRRTAEACPFQSKLICSDRSKCSQRRNVQYGHV